MLFEGYLILDGVSSIRRVDVNDVDASLAPDLEIWGPRLSREAAVLDTKTVEVTKATCCKIC